MRQLRLATVEREPAGPRAVGRATLAMLTASLRFTIKEALLATAPLPSDPVVPPLPTWRAPALIVVMPE